MNAHTGGLAEWPAWLLWNTTRRLDAVRWLHRLGSGVLLALAARVAWKLAATRGAALLAAAILATDWSFAYFHAALGGTQLLLGAATLLVWLGLLEGRPRTVGLGLGLGFGAKLTFAAPALGALLLAWTLPFRLDRGRLGTFVAWATLPVVPFLAGVVLASGTPPAAAHDVPGAQLLRLTGALSTVARDRWGNLVALFGDPRATFGPIYGIDAPAAWDLRIVGWALAAVGLALGARRGDVRCRGVALALVAQLALTGAVARDLHHLALLIPTAAAAAALGLAALPTGGRALGASLLIGAGLLQMAGTPALLRGVEGGTFTRDDQEDLAELLRTHAVARVVVNDYELFGAVEAVAPEVHAAHTFPIVRARGADALDIVVAHAAGGHLLFVRGAERSVYDLDPPLAAVQRAAHRQGLSVTPVAVTPDGSLLRVSAQGQ